MTAINQKEYLKKYLSLGSEPGKKKKRKKKSTSTSDRVKIIDDDVDVVTFTQAVEEDLYAQNEDAPQIVGVIDDRPLELRISDYRDSDLWKPVGEEHSGEIRNRMQSATITERTSDNAESIPDKYNDDYSPPRRKGSRFDRRSSSMQRDLKRRGSIDASPKRNARDNDRSPIRRVITDNDASPPRKDRRHSDASPVSRNRRDSDDVSPIRKNRRGSDNSPPRIMKNRSDSTKYKANDDRSPPRRYRKDRNSSPVRRDRYRRERSPIERNRKDYESSSSKRSRRASDTSPVRRNRRGSDPPSPDRRHYRNVSPPPKNRGDSDTSLPKKNKRDVSIERQGQIDRDISPIRKSKEDSDDRHITSPRKEKNDSSRRRMSRDDDRRSQTRRYSVEDRRSRDKSSRRSEDNRKGGRYESNKSTERRRSPMQIPRNVERREDAASTSSRSARFPRDQEPSRRTSPDLQPPPSRHSNKSGLQRANDIIMGKEPSTQSFVELSAIAGSSGNMAPIYRDRKTGKVRDFKREAEEARQKQEKEDELKAKYAKWGRGLKQVEDATEKLSSDLHEMDKPLARYVDDEDLERHLKEMEREGDPMLQYLRKKRQKQDIEAGKPSKPKFQGEFMPNRYAIRPGHRWDGVDRSNGYEKKWFEVMNSRRAQQEDAYKWSTEDM